MPCDYRWINERLARFISQLGSNRATAIVACLSFDSTFISSICSVSQPGQSETQRRAESRRFYRTFPDDSLAQSRNGRNSRWKKQVEKRRNKIFSFKRFSRKSISGCASELHSVFDLFPSWSKGAEHSLDNFFLWNIFLEGDIYFGWNTFDISDHLSLATTKWYFRRIIFREIPFVVILCFHLGFNSCMQDVYDSIYCTNFLRNE